MRRIGHNTVVLRSSKRSLLKRRWHLVVKGGRHCVRPATVKRKQVCTVAVEHAVVRSRKGKRRAVGDWTAAIDTDSGLDYLDEIGATHKSLVHFVSFTTLEEL